VVEVAQAGGPAYNMPMNSRVYVETSVISYLTARPSRDLIMAAHQEVTREWWQSQRHAFALFYSEAVRSEAAMGDPQAAAQRLTLLNDLNLLEIPVQAMGLANALVDATALPAKARVDALHIAIAAYEKMDFVLTWNFKHIANAQSASKVRQVCESFGLACPVLCSPLELLEVN
jgi:predicted nucleic acid-binding protein